MVMNGGVMGNRKVLTRLGAALVLCLAGSALGCHGGVNEPAGPAAPEAPEAPATSNASALSEQEAAYLAAFADLITSQGANYTCAYEGTSTVGEGVDSFVDVVSFTTKSDETDGIVRAQVVYGENDSSLSGVTFYSQGGQIVEVDPEGVAIDVSAVEETYEPDVSSGDVVITLLDHATAVQVSTESSDTVYTVTAEATDLGPVDYVDQTTNVTGTYRFNAEGHLMEEAATVEGVSELDGATAPANEAFTVTYTDWGITEVPFAPMVNGTYMPGDNVLLLDDLTAAVDAVPDNLTGVVESTVSMYQGEKVVNQTVHSEVFQDGDTALVYMEAPESGIDEMFVYLSGGKADVALNGEVTSMEYDYAAEDPLSMDKAHKLLTCIDSLDVINYGDGTNEYILVADPQKVTETVGYDAMAAVTYLEARYSVDADDQLTSVSMYAEGEPENPELGKHISVDAQVWYSDFNSTEVPNPFA